MTVLSLEQRARLLFLACLALCVIASAEALWSYSWSQSCLAAMQRSDASPACGPGISLQSGASCTVTIPVPLFGRPPRPARSAGDSF